MQYDTYNSREAAESWRLSGEYQKAAILYACTAHGEIGGTWDVKMRNPVNISIAMYSFLSSVVCHRLAGERSRSLNRAREAALVLEDCREHVFTDQHMIGLLYEYQGDLSVVSEQDTYEEFYQQAKELYDYTQQPPAWVYEDEFDWNREFYESLADTAGHEIDRPKYFHSFLQYKIDYKLSTFPDIVGSVYENGAWDSSSH